VQPPRRTFPRWTKIVGGVLGVLLGAALAFAIIQPIKVLPRIRVAPGYALVDQAGAAFTSETARGAVTLYSFVPLDCGEQCDEVASTLREVRDRVPLEADLADVDFRIVTIALADEPDPAALAAAAEASGADGEQWRWVGGEWDRVRTVVGAGFRRYFERDEAGDIEFDRGFVIVDGNGVIRAENRYATVSDDADKLVRQVGTLGDEIRYAHGFAALGYEAAHLFLCYE
jgi:protein SCO1